MGQESESGLRLTTSPGSALSSCECPFPHYLSGGLFLLHPLLRVCPSFAAHSFGCSFNPHQFQFHIYTSLPIAY